MFLALCRSLALFPPLLAFRVCDFTYSWQLTERALLLLLLYLGMPQGHVRVRPEGRVLRHHWPRQARQPLPQRGAEVERHVGGAG